jgi:hypothetical protein
MPRRGPHGEAVAILRFGQIIGSRHWRRLYLGKGAYAPMCEHILLLSMTRQAGPGGGAFQGPHLTGPQAEALGLSVPATVRYDYARNL